MKICASFQMLDEGLPLLVDLLRDKQTVATRIRGPLADRLLRLPRRGKQMLALSLDVAICAWTSWAALYLRLGEWRWLAGNQWLTIAAAIVIAIPLFSRFGLYRAIFRHTGWPSAVAVSAACSVYGCAYALIFTFVGVDDVPRTVGLIQPVLLFIAIAASRGFAHFFLGGRYQNILQRERGRNVLIYGAGAAGRQLASALSDSPEMKVVGFLDDDVSLHGGLINGLRIMNPHDAAWHELGHDVSDVLLAVPSASRRRRREILDLLRPAGVNVCTVPGLMDLAGGRLHVVELRPLDLEDLLGRDAVAPDALLLSKKIEGKVVLVTGGGGSIGSELCRQILDAGPTTLVLIELSEYALYAIHQELEDRIQERGGPATAIVPLLASVGDEDRMRAIMTAWRPATIYHAAAYKHVNLVELNPGEGLKNNVLGTYVMARLAVSLKVSDFILVSTDKAVRPTNIMGASKRLAEHVIQAIADVTLSTRFSIVRFGNVLGSSGSVVPLFRRQIAEGGPVTITDPDVTRYFMTIPEAAQLVIQAGAIASGGDVFVLDMGKPVRVLDLAVNMINLSGLSVRDERNPDGDIEIKVIGLRPGEKLHEELLIGENPMPTQHERIIRAREQFVALNSLKSALDQLSAVLENGNIGKAIEILCTLLPEYRPSEEIAWLDLTDPVPDNDADPPPRRRAAGLKQTQWTQTIGVRVDR